MVGSGVVLGDVGNAQHCIICLGAGNEIPEGGLCVAEAGTVPAP
jgi:hypothetical protein